MAIFITFSLPGLQRFQKLIKILQSLNEEKQYGLYFAGEMEAGNCCIVILDSGPKPSDDPKKFYQNLFRKSVPDVEIKDLKESYHISLANLTPYTKLLLLATHPTQNTSVALGEIVNAADNAYIRHELSDPSRSASRRLDIADLNYQKKHVLFEKALLAIGKLVNANHNTPMSEQAIMAQFSSLLHDANFHQIQDGVVETENENTVELLVRVSSDLAEEYSRRNGEKLYSTMELLKKNLSEIMSGTLIETHFDTRTFDKALIRYKDFAVPLTSRTNFLFSLQRILLQTGLLNVFMVSVQHKRERKLLFQEKFNNFMEKYKLNDLSPATFERGLRNATANGMVDDVKFVLQHLKINIDAQDKNPTSQRTALHLAVERGHADCIIALLEAGARFDIPAANKMTAMNLAILQRDTPEMQMVFVSEQLRREKLEESKSSCRPGMRN